MFVTGCHRSGTSLLASVVAQVLARLRPDAPVAALTERSDLEPALDNPGGFFESPQLRLFNDELLHLAGCPWDRPPLVGVDWTALVPQERWEKTRAEFRLQALDRHWIDKDPRLAITYRAWTHVFLRRIPLLVVLRDPLEVAVSLFSRNGKGWELDRGLLLWFLYNHHLALVVHADDFVVSYQELLSSVEDPQQCLAAELSAWLLDHGFSGATRELCGQVLASSVDPSLQRSATTLDVVPGYSQAGTALLKCCSQAYQRVCQARENRTACFVESFQDLPRQILEVRTSHGERLGLGPVAQGQITQLQAAFDQERQAFDQERQAFDQERQQLESSFSKHLEEHRELIRQQELQLATTYRSLSWRSTAPLRRLMAWVRSSR